MGSEQKNKNSDLVDKEIKDLGEILSGEMLLREKREEIIKAKKNALQEQRKKINEGIKKGSIKIRELNKNKKIIQKIKLFEWEAPVRIPFQFDKKNFLLVLAVCLFFILYLAILGHYALMFAIISLLFLIYVAGTTKPVDIKHYITAKGVETMDVLYEWYTLESFFFTKKKEQHILIIETNLKMPSRLIILANKKDLGSIFLLLQDQLLYKDIKKQSKFDILNIGEYIPLEKI